jgi:hypothetical protein
VVRFEPVGPEDEAARQETDYVNHVFMQQNPGFMILYSFIKDALLSKVGIVKVWWEEREEESRDSLHSVAVLTDQEGRLYWSLVALRRKWTRYDANTAPAIPPKNKVQKERPQATK